MMIHMKRCTAILLAALLMLGSVARGLAQDDEITLVPFSSETFGVKGVIPEGWTEAAPGVYARGASAGDLTSVIIQAAPGMTAEALTGVLLGQLGIEALPDSTGSLETDTYLWTLYAISVEQMGMQIQVDLALSEDESGVTLVLLQTLEDEYAALHEAVFLPVVEALAPITADESAETADESVYEDPAGRFSVPVPTNWQVDEREGYTFLYSPDELITVSILVIETDEPAQAMAQAWAVVDPDFDQQVTETLEIPTSTLDQFLLYTYASPEDEGVIQAEARVYRGSTYILIFEADLTAIQHRQAQVQIIDSGFNITALEDTDLSAAEPVTLTDDLIAEFEAYITEAMDTFETPGAAVVIVRDGEIVYAQGFGMRNPAGDPVTPETRMMIGSTTKTMTTLLMAQMVDAGVMDWDTPVVEVMPGFAVADPDVTQAITMQNLVCACTGVPRRDFELIFNSSDLTAESVIESLATFEFFTDFGEAFQYSNQMVAAAGYITALAAGGEYGTLYDDYVSLMEDRIFAPLDMASTTFSFDEVLASDDYAVPYGQFWDFSFEPIPFSVEESFLTPIAPAGAAWSTALDMANYMIMQLNDGVGPDGTRIVSAKNLVHTRTPQVAISASDDYGLGWIVSNWHGVQVLSHGGNTFGFTANFTFLPEHDLGAVVLTNQRLSFLNDAVWHRLAELLFEQPHTYHEQALFSFEQLRERVQGIGNGLEPVADPAIAALAVGTYANEALGSVTITLRDDGVLIFDSGDYQSEMWVYTGDQDDAERILFFCTDPPLNEIGIRFEPDDDGIYQMTLGGGVEEYAFERLE